MFDTAFTGNEIAGSYNLWLVFLSYTVISLASFTAFDLATRIKESHGISRNVWIGGCAFTMGVHAFHRHAGL